MNSDDLISFFRSYKFFWFSVCGLFLLNLAFYSIFIRGQQNKIEGLQQRYSQIRRQAKGEQHKTEGMMIAANVRKELEKFRQKIPNRNLLSIQVGKLYKVLNKYPVSVGKITFKPERDKTLSMWRYSASIVIKGEYPLQKKALADIQNLSNIYAIEDVTFSKGSSRSDKLELKLRIVIYLT